MKTLLVVGSLPALAEAVQAAVDPAAFRVVHRATVAEAVPLLSHSLANACLVDAEGQEVQGLWEVEQLRKQFPMCPVVVFGGPPPWTFEEEAYLLGVAQVLAKPVRSRLLNAVLSRLFAPASAAPPPAPLPAPAPPPAPLPLPPPGQLRVWQVLKDFSSVLTHSLCAEALLRQFLQFLRENMGINRAAIFLRPPPTVFGRAPASAEPERLHSFGSLGLAAGLLDHFQLSLASGIGGQVVRSGRILRRTAYEAQHDPEMQKEFEILGAQVAIPVQDRDALLGVAVFDGHLTGEQLTNDELELIFHLLAELGLTVRNIWLHDQLVDNHALVSEILQQLNSGCVVVGRDLQVLQANKKARALFPRAGGRAGELDFTDLPSALGSKLFLALKTGAGVAPFRYHPPERPGAVYNISIVPFQKVDTASPASVLLLVDDLTESEQLQKLERENARLRPLKTVAARLAHEIGNALVPLSIHQQLLGEKYEQAEFRNSLDQAMADGVRRILRLVTQLKFLTQDPVANPQAINLEELVREAVAAALGHQPAARPECVHFQAPAAPVIIAGDREALETALAEVVLNALQSGDGAPRIEVLARQERDAGASGWALIEVRDQGGGFSPEAAIHFGEPFFTTRTTGVGLGLAVCRRVVENHRGKLEILADTNRPGGLVRISLPLAGG